jgi:colicin import membrane protein
MPESAEPVVKDVPGRTPPLPWMADAPAAVDGRATLLLVMRPGRNGIRALNPTADPILCSNDVCWVSRGPDRDARMVPRRKALGPLNTLGERAGACNGSTGCVFRNVELGGASAVVQPIDLRVIRHDRRAPVEVRIDRSCRIDEGRLDCPNKAASADYRIWAVPEATAQAAGARALMSAVGAPLRTAARDRD